MLIQSSRTSKHYANSAYIHRPRCDNASAKGTSGRSHPLSLNGTRRHPERRSDDAGCPAMGLLMTGLIGVVLAIVVVVMGLSTPHEVCTLLGA